MTSFVKSIVNRLLFKKKVRKTFVPVRLAITEISERVYFVTHSNKTDVTFQHCVVCHSPFCIAVWSSNAERQQFEVNSATMQIINGKRVVANVDVRLKHEVECAGNFVMVYEIIKARCHQLPYWHQYTLLKRYFLRKKKDSFLEGMIYGATYSFPRQVIIVSYKDESYFNIFPMDFQCFVEKGNTIILGLRTTNTTLSRILQSRSVVISDTSSVGTKTIYDLGRNHSSRPLSLADLPFDVISSKKFGSHVPVFSSSYKEFEIVKSVELGTHTMMVGNLVSSETLRNEEPVIHHVHFFEYVVSGYEEAN